MCGASTDRTLWTGSAASRHRHTGCELRGGRLRRSPLFVAYSSTRSLRVWVSGAWIDSVERSRVVGWRNKLVPAVLVVRGTEERLAVIAGVVVVDPLVGAQQYLGPVDDCGCTSFPLRGSRGLRRAIGRL